MKNLSYQAQSAMHDFAVLMPFIVGTVLILLIILAIIAYAYVNSDNKLPEKIAMGKIVEKEGSSGTGGVQWIVFESEDGERIRLRTYKGREQMLQVGDTGKVIYKGNTIQSFER